MDIKVVLFDLDGTLLPMDQDTFTKEYFKGISAKLAQHGYEPNELIDAIWAGTMAMIKNDGNKTNEEVFREDFIGLYGCKAKDDIIYFDEFYRTEFEEVKNFCGYTPKAAQVISQIKAKGMKVALATNPIFPAIATESRMRWAGLDKEDFELYTTYENSCYSKPNTKYYEDITKILNVFPEECLMVGNDVGDDMVAAKLGMKVFLLTDCLINKKKEDINKYPNGSFDKLADFINSL